jgi:hypothetical protein
MHAVLVLIQLQKIFEIYSASLHTYIDRNRHLPFGRYDAILHLPVFGIPLVVLVVGAALDQIQPNIVL